MIIRNFLKNKINLIYALILFIVFGFIVLINYLDNKRMDYYNEHNEVAYIVFEAPLNVYNRVKEIDIIDNITLGVRLLTKPGGMNYVFESNKLKKNEFIADDGIFFDLAINDKVILVKYNIELEVVSKINSFNQESYISEELLNEIITNEDSVLYMVSLNDWSNLGGGISEINKLSLLSTNRIRVNNYFEDINYDTRYYVFRTLLIGIVVVGFYFVLKSVLIHEKEKSYMYYCLGFTKGQLIRLSILKVILLFIPGLIFYCLILL